MSLTRRHRYDPSHLHTHSHSVCVCVCVFLVSGVALGTLVFGGPRQRRELLPNSTIFRVFFHHHFTCVLIALIRLVIELIKRSLDLLMIIFFSIELNLSLVLFVGKYQVIF